jgi:hypothetical protein
LGPSFIALFIVSTIHKDKFTQREAEKAVNMEVVVEPFDELVFNIIPM